MGGNALQVPSVRLSAADYHTLENRIVQQLRQAFPHRRIESVLAYAEKADFGDMDLLIEGGADYNPLFIAQTLQANEVVRNGDVTSIGIALEAGVFQLDLIETPSASFDFASRYFGFNDMGNLLGRIAHKCGAKFGHLGLLYPLRDPENDFHLLAELTITTDFGLALRLFGYDDARYEDLRRNAGFRTLQDIFQFVVSSPYVNRDIYLLENRNHKARIRDAKRPTYTAFLAWLDEQAVDSLPAYPWAPSGSEERIAQQQAFLEQAFAICPDFQARYQQAVAIQARKNKFKQCFNGALVSAITGLSGKTLGRVMSDVRMAFSDETAFEDFFIQADEAAIRACLLHHAAQVTAGKPEGF